MSDLSKAIDLIDAINGMPFEQVSKALDRVQVHLFAVRRKYEADNLQLLSAQEHRASHIQR